MVHTTIGERVFSESLPLVTYSKFNSLQYHCSLVSLMQSCVLKPIVASMIIKHGRPTRAAYGSTVSSVVRWQEV
jgi:hypothetical protein